jgi:hypothetical protein
MKYLNIAMIFLVTISSINCSNDFEQFLKGDVQVPVLKISQSQQKNYQMELMELAT